jgi:hypothetical protein
LRCIQTFGRRVLHIFDRGFATEPWLHLCVILHQRFVVRWPHGQYLIDEQGRTRHPPGRLRVANEPGADA